jgi:hypothetical protein
MNLQYLHDNNGNTTGVFMSIEQWKSLKNKYVDLQIEESQTDKNLTIWQKEILDERLNDYHTNENQLSDFEQTISNVRKTL